MPAIRGFLPWLLAAALVDWLGTGLFLAVSTVFFVRFVGLSVAEVGAGLTIAALAAMPTLVPAGRLADRFGPRTMLILVEVVQGAATAGYLAVHDWWGFLAVTFLVAVSQQAAPPLIQALVGELAAGERRTKILAVHRTVINIGLAVGGLVAGVLLGSGLKDAFQVLLIADAAAFLVAAALVGALANPKHARVRLPSERKKALRDPRLLALSGYDAVMSLWQPMLNVAFPLWLITRTHAPVSLVGVLYGVACGCAIAFQYPASVLIATAAKALRGYSCAALCLAMIEGTLIAESIRVGAELDGVRLVARKIRRAAAGDAAAGQPELWTFVEFEAEEHDAGTLALALAKALDQQHGWYTDFRTPDETFVVYSGRVFRYPRGDNAGRAEAAACGRSLGVPENQLDWPE